MQAGEEQGTFRHERLEWNFVKILLPNKPRGVHRVDDRRVINGIFVRSAHWHPVAGYARTVRPMVNDL